MILQNKPEKFYRINYFNAYSLCSRTFIR